MVSGVLSILQGISGIAEDNFYVATGRFVYKFDLTAWGWIHLVIGVALVFVGWAVLSGRAWARWTGVGLASVSLVTQFMFLPHYPLWAIVVMALDVFVIWGLATFREWGGRAY
jgi:hypothetical protein